MFTSPKCTECKRYASSCDCKKADDDQVKLFDDEDDQPNNKAERTCKCHQVHTKTACSGKPCPGWDSCPARERDLWKAAQLTGSLVVCPVVALRNG